MRRLLLWRLWDYLNDRQPLWHVYSRFFQRTSSGALNILLVPESFDWVDFAFRPGYYLEGRVWLTLVWFVRLLLTPVFIVFHSLLYALIWTTEISAQISDIRARNMSDPLDVLPAGRFGVYLHIIHTALHRLDAEGVPVLQGRKPEMVLMAFVLCLVISGRLYVYGALSEAFQAFYLAFFALWLSVSVTLWLDHVHSVVVGVLMALLSTSLAVQGVPVWSAVLLLLERATTGLGIIALSWFSMRFLPGLAGYWTPFLLACALPIGYLMLTEGTVRFLWHVVHQRLEFTDSHSRRLTPTLTQP